MSERPEPYLSVVAASRNDDHGGNPLQRTQIFVNAFLDQCRIHRLPGELIIVDWNPPAGRPGLVTALKFDRINDFGTARVIAVPAELHQRIENGKNLPMFQMLAKNVGIRRARGKFILATNIDILLSNELFAWLARQELREDRMYRVDRCDVDSRIPVDAPLEAQLRFCKENLIRAHPRTGTLVGDQLKAYSVSGNGSLEPQLADPKCKVFPWREDPVAPGQPEPVYPKGRLHTNASGDFTLISRKKWHELRGYPELEVHALHLDALFCGLAHYAGALEASLPPPAAAYHIEHAVGSGCPQGQRTLVETLRSAGVSCLCVIELVPWFQQARLTGQPLLFNNESWGLGGFKEAPDAASPIGLRLTEDPDAPQQPVLSIKPEFARSVLGVDHFRREIRGLQKELQELRALKAKGN
jgi:hypothetical protein